ncbi:hypothetical protein L596_022426 [Steinernema carpocapsae]|uniref:Uncharacterized protein n=1 Tax=Steinernema carpocapsae TaxID=34508 RepID=A0A4U5MM26_STECR|nr:hypothetical protein L596_022426 [Steinernema carpocapsae]
MDAVPLDFIERTVRFSNPTDNLKEILGSWSTVASNLIFFNGRLAFGLDPTTEKICATCQLNVFGYFMHLKSHEKVCFDLFKKYLKTESFSKFHVKVGVATPLPDKCPTEISPTVGSMLQNLCFVKNVYLTLENVDLCDLTWLAPFYAPFEHIKILQNSEEAFEKFLEKASTRNFRKKRLEFSESTRENVNFYWEILNREEVVFINLSKGALAAPFLKKFGACDNELPLGKTVQFAKEGNESVYGYCAQFEGFYGKIHPSRKAAMKFKEVDEERFEFRVEALEEL